MAKTFCCRITICDNVFIDVHLLAYHILIQNSSMYRNETYKVQDLEALSWASFSSQNEAVLRY
jgi:hypothetical protein